MDRLAGATPADKFGWAPPPASAPLVNSYMPVPICNYRLLAKPLEA